MASKSLSDALQECTTRCQTMDAPLPLRLQAFADDVRNLSPDFADIVDRMVAHLMATGLGENAPKPGEPMPDFVMPDQTGRLHSLGELIEFRASGDRLSSRTLVPLLSHQRRRARGDP